MHYDGSATRTGKLEREPGGSTYLQHSNYVFTNIRISLQYIIGDLILHRSCMGIFDLCIVRVSQMNPLSVQLLPSHQTSFILPSARK